MGRKITGITIRILLTQLVSNEWQKTHIFQNKKTHDSVLLLPNISAIL